MNTAKPLRIAIAIEIDEPHRRHQDVFAGAQKFGREHPEWVCIFDEYPLDGQELQNPGRLAYDGMIARASTDMIARSKQARVPLVNVHYQTRQPGCATVLPDPVSTGQAAADHLIGLGMPRLCLITDKHHKFFNDVGAAFTTRAQEEGVPCTVSYFKEPAYRNKKGWLQMNTNVLRCLSALTPPSGIFAATAPLARVLIQHAQTKGWRVPRDLAVLCGRDLAAVVEVEPKISAIEVDYNLIGYRAAQLLNEMMAGKPIPTQPIYIPPGPITARESTDYRVVNDELVALALHHISDNLNSKLRIDDIAYAINSSPRLLQQRFAEHLKTGISQEIRRLRLEKAKRLLTEPDRLIKNIPQLCGFASPNAMNKIFIRELGITPSGYRKRILNEKLYEQRPEKPGTSERRFRR